MSITVFANLKGGVGKTLVTLGCAHAAAAAGARVLLVDTDPQGNVTSQITAYTAEAPPPVTLADVLDRQTAAPIESAIIPTRRPGIELLPSGFDELQAVQDALFGKPGAEHSLDRALRPCKDRWDHVFIDTRPATDLITRNALIAADSLVLILEPEVPAIRGADCIMRAVDELEEYLGKTLPVGGWVINRVDYRRTDHEEYTAKIVELAAEDGVPILGDPIPLTADLARLSVVGMGIDEHRRPNARLRNMATNFADIVDGIDHLARTPA
ncbi:MAG: AAA family ATPase [Actinomycetia bacterium]|nr:AAA family ATPase [Actinomycetes bacterium]